MKIQILYLKENDKQKFEIEVAEFDRVMDLKNNCFIDFYKDDKYFMHLIHGDIILNESNYIKFYKMGPSDEIYIGRIEHILKDYEIILDVFVISTVHELVHLIVNRHTTIADIKSKLNVFIESENAQIWDDKGSLLGNEEIISEIDVWESRKIILRFSITGFWFPICFSLIISMKGDFRECSQLHDQDLQEKYFLNYVWRFWAHWDDSFVTVEMKRQLVDFGLHILKKMAVDPQLEETLTLFPSAFRKSRFLFCSAMTNCIFRIFEHCLRSDWERNQGRYEGVALGLFQYIFFVALRVAVLSFLDDENQSMSHVMSVLSEYLRNPTLIEADWTQRFRQYFRCAPADMSQLDVTRWKAWNSSNASIRLSIRGEKISWLKLSKNTETVFQARLTISSQIKVHLNQLYLIRSDDGCNAKDEDKFEINKSNFNKFTFEIICSSEEFEKIQKIGQTPSSMIFLCEHKTSTEKLALKKPLKESLDADIRVYFHISGAPNIPIFKGLYYDEGVICMAMEYMPKGPLNQYLEHRVPLPEVEIANISYEILLQMKELERKRVIHYDIKSRNILFDENLKPKLMDYGSAIIHENLDELEPFVDKNPPGTLGYMAPELALGESYSNKIDIWSFGVTVREMITGKRPYPQKSLVHTQYYISKTRRIDIDSPINVSTNFRNFLDLCLDPDPKRRASVDTLLESQFILEHCDESR